MLITYLRCEWDREQNDQNRNHCFARFHEPPPFLRMTGTNQRLCRCVLLPLLGCERMRAEPSSSVRAITGSSCKFCPDWSEARTLEPVGAGRPGLVRCKRSPACSKPGNSPPGLPGSQSGIAQFQLGDSHGKETILLDRGGFPRCFAPSPPWPTEGRLRSTAATVPPSSPTEIPERTAP